MRIKFGARARGAARTRCVPSSAVRKDGRARRTHFLAIFFLMGAFFFGAAFFTTFFTGFLTTCGHASEQEREKA